MVINQLTLDSINNYYKVLKAKGALGYCQVYMLFVLSFIDDLCKDEYSGFMTDEEYEMLSSVITCMSKHSCIIPYTQVALHTASLNNYTYIVSGKTIYTNPVNNYMLDTPTLTTEDDVIRITEEYLLRIQSVM